MLDTKSGGWGQGAPRGPLLGGLLLDPLPPTGLLLDQVSPPLAVRELRVRLLALATGSCWGEACEGVTFCLSKSRQKKPLSICLWKCVGARLMQSRHRQGKNLRPGCSGFAPIESDANHEPPPGRASRRPHMLRYCSSICCRWPSCDWCCPRHGAADTTDRRAPPIPRTMIIGGRV